MTRKRIQLFLGLLVTAFFLYLAFRKVEWDDLWKAIRTVNYIWAIPFMAVTVLSMYFRTIRWKYLLKPVVDVPTRKLFSPLIICFFLNSILPGRAGEFARAYLVGRDHKAAFSSTFATVVVERIADALGLLALFVVILATVDLGTGMAEEWGSVKQIQGARIILYGSIGLAVLAVFFLALAFAIRRAASRRPDVDAARGGLMQLLGRIDEPRPYIRFLYVLAALCVIGTVAFVAGLIVDPDRIYTYGRKYVIDAKMLHGLSKKMLFLGIVMLAGSILMLWGPFRRFTQAIIGWTPFLPQGFKDSLNRFIETFVQGFHSLRSPTIIFWVIVHTATVWMSVGWSIVLMAKGFGLSISFLQGMGVSIIICIAILIPAAPGYWGLYEVGCILALKMLGIVEDRATALGFSLVLHFLQMVPILALGIWFLWRRRVGLAELTVAPSKNAE